jgi:hypothetical protein
VRNRPIRPVVITVRRLNPQETDSLGDASPFVSDTRLEPFTVRAQLTWSRRSMHEDGMPGRTEQASAFCLIRKVDVPAALRSTWQPSTNDLFIVPGVGSETDGLMVTDVQPALPVRPSFANPSGGFEGWRVALVSRSPSIGVSAGGY